MDRFFLLDDKALGLIEPKRLPHTRLGCAVQLTTLLFLGTILPDPTDVPTEVVDYLAEQLGIDDPSCVKAYRAREMTRLEHAREIRDAYGFGEFTDAEPELVRWVDDRAWTTGDGPKALFNGAVAWLRERRVLLPGVSTPARLVARVRDAAMQRLWDTIAGSLSAAQAHALELLLEVGEGARTSDLERLRRGQTRVSGRVMVAALDRVSEITALGIGQVELGAVPRRRVVELARYGMAGKAPALRRHPYARRLATLLATVVYLQAKATDDAVELFDVLMTTELPARAQRQSRDEQARRYPRVSRDAGKLAAAVGVLLEAAEWGPEIGGGPGGRSGLVAAARSIGRDGFAGRRAAGPTPRPAAPVPRRRCAVPAGARNGSCVVSRSPAQGCWSGPVRRAVRSGTTTAEGSPRPRPAPATCGARGGTGRTPDAPTSGDYRLRRRRHRCRRQRGSQSWGPRDGDKPSPGSRAT